MLRESSNSTFLTPGTQYAFSGGDFLGVVDPLNHTLAEADDSGLLEGKYNGHDWVSSDTPLTYIGKVDHNGVAMYSFATKNESGQDSKFFIPVQDEAASKLISALKPLNQNEAKAPSGIMPTPDAVGDYTANNDKFPATFIGDFEKGIKIANKGGKASDSVGRYGSDTISGRKEGGEDESGEDLLGKDKGTPEDFDRETKGGKSKKDAHIGDDALTGKDPKVKYEPSEKELGNTSEPRAFKMGTKKMEAVEVDKDDEDDDEKKDKEKEVLKRKKLFKDDDDDEDKKRKDEAVDADDDDDDDDEKKDKEKDKKRKDEAVDVEDEDDDDDEKKDKKNDKKRKDEKVKFDDDENGDDDEEEDEEEEDKRRDKKDKKRKDEASDMKTKNEKPKKEKDVDKDDDGYEEDDKEDKGKGNPKKSKEVATSSRDADDEKADDEDNEGDDADNMEESVSLFLQKIGSAVFRTVMDEAIKNGKTKLLKNERFIQEVARRVSRFERLGEKAVLPQIKEAKLVYPSTHETVSYVDILVFESNGQYIIVDQLDENKMYETTSNELVESVIKSGVDKFKSSLSHLQERITLKSDGKEYKFL